MNLLDFIKLVRPVHWIKNISLFAALVFTQGLLVPSLFMKVFWAFWAFSLAASATYAFNDTLDSKRDSEHLIKKNRPIARGAISRKQGLFFSFTLATVSLLWAHTISPIFFILVALYLVIQIGYSLLLKNFHIVDILLIAAGFVIRVYAGAFVLNAHLSVWFLLSVLSVALFLAAGKRRAELGVMGEGGGTRSTLSQYPKELLNSYVTMFGNAAWMSWSLFTFFESPRISQQFWLFLAELSRTASVGKLLMVTIPVTIYIVMRYQSLIFEDRTEAPEKVLLTDFSLMGGIFLWAVLVLVILYGGISSF